LRACITLPLAGFGSFNDSLLLAQCDRFTMLLGRPHASHTDLFLQDEPTLDNEDFLDNRDDRGVAFLSDWWGRINGAADRNTLDFNPLMSKRLINQMVTINRMEMHPNVPFNLSALNRNIFDVQRDDDLGRI
jgi:hypothetical protein